MQNNSILLSLVMQALSRAAADANRSLHSDYVNSLTNPEEWYDNPIIPPPLNITDVKMTFLANISRAKQPLSGELVLDFTKPRNFTGEIRLQSLVPQPSDAEGYKIPYTVQSSAEVSPEIKDCSIFTAPICASSEEGP